MRRTLPAIRALLPVLAAGGLLAGCGEEMSTLAPAGGPAEALAELSWLVYGTFLGVAAVMMGLILWPVLRRRRGSFLEHAPIDTTGGQPWILIGGFAVPFVILAVLFVAGLQTMAAYPLHDGEIPAPQIRVVGHQWWWEVKYVAGPPSAHFVTANEIHIPVGQLVDLEVTSADVIHSFWVPRLHGKADLIPGHPNRIRLRADRPGAYRGQCAEYCGAQHARMALLVVAHPPDEYAAWLEHQRQPARPPATALARDGQEVFLSRPCALCHSVRGTPARGGVAPDLTHFGSRRGLAANSYENNTANLSAWVTHAQSLKPEVMMPNVTQMTGRELRALVAYLEGLE